MQTKVFDKQSSPNLQRTSNMTEKSYVARERATSPMLQTRFPTTVQYAGGARRMNNLPSPAHFPGNNIQNGAPIGARAALTHNHYVGQSRHERLLADPQNYWQHRDLQTFYQRERHWHGIPRYPWEYSVFLGYEPIFPLVDYYPYEYVPMLGYEPLSADLPDDSFEYPLRPEYQPLFSEIPNAQQPVDEPLIQDFAPANSQRQNQSTVKTPTAAIPYSPYPTIRLDPVFPSDAITTQAAETQQPADMTQNESQFSSAFPTQQFNPVFPATQ
jgi:hypothetical protein